MENLHRESSVEVGAGLRFHAVQHRDGAWPRAPHTRRPALSSRYVVHVVVLVRSDVWNLRTRECFREVERAIYEGCERFGFRLIHFSVRDDHIHLIAEADNKCSLSRGMQGLNVRMAKAINRVQGRHGSVFADRFHAAIVRTVDALRALINYVIPNFRWDFAEVELDEPDPFSSGAGPVVVPRNWLMREEPG